MIVHSQKKSQQFHTIQLDCFGHAFLFVTGKTPERITKRMVVAHADLEIVHTAMTIVHPLLGIITAVAPNFGSYSRYTSAPMGLWGLVSALLMHLIKVTSWAQGQNHNLYLNHALIRPWLCN